MLVSICNRVFQFTTSSSLGWQIEKNPLNFLYKWAIYNDQSTVEHGFNLYSMPCRPGRNTPLNLLAVCWHYSIIGNYLRSNRLFRSFSLRHHPRQPAATTGCRHTCLPTPSGPPPSTSSPQSLKVLWQSCCNRSLYFSDDLDPVRLHIHPSVSEHMCHMDSAAGSWAARRGVVF